MADIPGKEILKDLSGMGASLDDTLNSLTNMSKEAYNLNTAFVQGRIRIDEMMDAVSKSAAGIIRLGGNLGDVSKTMSDIAEGSRRNVLATETQVSKLYASSKILSVDSKTLVENFASVGIETSKIGPSIEKSINYVQNLGLNAKSVVGDVANNMKLMNQFNFTDGVQGLTKMAAQASMLRFDMQETATFANKVMDPEQAINMAAALQRLGVASGDLADPFSMMNDAINDPGALQDSLINATKQFTEFDEKTKTFKINPQGILTLREMAKETGVGYDTLAKSALAAADLDERLSAVNPSINFKNEDDKKLLANMATMGEGGEYVVQIRDDKTGEINDKKLADITKEEFEKLRNAPKTVEEIQKSQLGFIEGIATDLKSIVAKVTYGVAGATPVRANLAGAQRITSAVTSSIDAKVPGSVEIGKKVTDGIEKLRDLFIDKDNNKISDGDFSSKVSKLGDVIKSQLEGIGPQALDTAKKILQESNKKITGNSEVEQGFKNFSEKLLNSMGGTIKKSGTESSNKVKPTALTREQVVGGVTRNPYSDALFNNTSQTNQTTNAKVEFGNLNVNVTAPNGMSEQSLIEIFNKQQFKEYIWGITGTKPNEKGQGVRSYGK